jgi:hypothetical protein
MAGWCSPGKIAVLDDIQHFCQHSSDFLKVGRSEFNCSHRIAAASVNNEPSAHSALEMFLYQQCINGRLKSERTVDNTRITGELVIEGSGGSVLKKQHFVNAAPQTVAFTDQTHIDPLVHGIQPFPEIAAIVLFACLVQRTAHLNLGPSLLELRQHLVFFKPGETRAVEMFEHIADRQQNAGKIEIHNRIHFNELVNLSVISKSRQAEA